MSDRLFFGGLRLAGALVVQVGFGVFGFFFGLISDGDDDLFTSGGTWLYFAAVACGALFAVRVLSRAYVPQRVAAVVVIASALVWESGALELEPVGDVNGSRFRMWLDADGNELLYGDANPAMLIAAWELGRAAVAVTFGSFIILLVQRSRAGGDWH